MKVLSQVFRAENVTSLKHIFYLKCVDEAFNKGLVKYRFSLAMRNNDANKMTPLPPTAPCCLRHFQNFDKIGSFLRPVFNICICIFNIFICILYSVFASFYVPF